MTLDMITGLCSLFVSYPPIDLVPRQRFKSKQAQLWKETRKNGHVLYKLESQFTNICWSKKVTRLSPESECGGSMKLQDEGHKSSGPLVQSTYHSCIAFLTDPFNQSWFEQRSTATTHQLIKKKKVGSVLVIKLYRMVRPVEVGCRPLCLVLIQKPFLSSRLALRKENRI